jgi:hypothetical protein
MANTLNVDIISEGFKKAVVRFYFESDGTEGEWVNKPIFDPSNDFIVPMQQGVNTDANPAVAKVPQISILKAWCSASWFDITLSFNSMTPSPELVIARDTDFDLDFTYFGGVKDRSGPVITDGILLISTKDFAPAGSNGFMVLELRKD